MPDLRIGATVDLSAANAALQQGQQSVQQYCDQMNVSFQTVSTGAQNFSAGTRNAFTRLSEDVKSSADSVSGDAVRIAEATRANANAQLQLRLAQRVAKDESIDQAVATRLVASAQQNARAAAAELAAANEAVSMSAGHAVTDVQATSAAIRTLDGNPGIRAVERFIVTIPGLSTVMQSIFPVIGLAGLAGMFITMGDKAVEAGEKAVHATERLKEAWTDAHEKAQINIDDLAVQNDKLQDEIDKLSGHPNNGLQTALDEARKMADKLLESLQADRKALEELLKEHSVGVLSSQLTGVAATGTQASQLLADQTTLTGTLRKANADFDEVLAVTKDPAKIKTATDARNAAVRAAFQSQINAYKAEAARLRKEQADSERDAQAAANAGQGSVGVNAIDNSAKLTNIEGRRKQLEDLLKTENLEESIASRTSTVGALKQGKEDKSESNKAAEQRFKQMEADLNEWKILAPVTAQAEFDYWAQRRDSFVAGSEQYNQVVAKQATLAIEGSRRAAEEIKRFRDQQNREAAEGSQVENNILLLQARLLQQNADEVTKSGTAWEGYQRAIAQGAENQAQFNGELQLLKIASDEASGHLTRLGALQAEAGVHAEEHRRKLAALRAELTALQSTAPRDAIGNISDPKVAEREQAIKNQIAQEQGKGKVQAAQDQNAITRQIEQPYLAAFNQIENSWMTAQRAMLTGQKTFAQAMKQMWGGIAMDAIQNIEKVLFTDLQHIAQRLLAHQAANQLKVASDATTAEEGTAIDADATQKGVLHDAAGAAAGAFKGVMKAVPPPFNAILAPVAAGAAFAGTLAIGSFDMGGIVGGPMGAPQIIQAHAGERVLSLSQSSRFEQMVNGSGGGSPTINFGGSHTYSGGADGAGWRAGLKEHRVAMAREITALMREGHIKPA